MLPKARGRGLDIESLQEFDTVVARGPTTMDGWRVQSIDLRARTAALLGLDPGGALFLGCPLEDRADRYLREHGALVFPAIPALPFNPYRGGLYTPGELYEGLERSSYEGTLDARVYAWSRRSDSDLAGTLARALHDLAIDDAMEDSTPDRPVVGVMGGHSVDRGTGGYRQAVSLGRALARAGFFVATGGGPGAMEAANLGAYLSAHDDTAVQAALTALARVASFRPSVTAWATAAFEVRRCWPDGQNSLGIPTWFYGHEPPNVLASSIAKYFQNALREDVLVSRCTGGIVFLPGAAGTVQEIFQDACENYYASPAGLAPMVLVGMRHWNVDVPAWPLLRALAADRGMKDKLFLVDTVGDALAALPG